MPKYLHERHKSPFCLPDGCDLVIACPPFRSRVNLSRIIRAASCSGVHRIIACGRPKIDSKIARDGATEIQLECHRSLPPVLKRLRQDGYLLVGLEQATNSQRLRDFAFPQRTVLVIGHERTGIDQETLDLLDAVVEIPMFGLPHSLNVATATAIAIYEYCRQHGTTEIGCLTRPGGGE
jgi:tRNA G18 (ribose-2'-O)-methylase SpoU